MTRLQPVAVAILALELVLPFSAQGATLATLYAFTGTSDGGNPYAALINADGTLYGTTFRGGSSDNGTVFKIDPATGAETVVHTFTGGNDGSQPESPLVKVGAAIYGTTVYGGPYDKGTVFKINPVTGVEKVVYSFAGGNDGSQPEAALINVGGIFYGTTAVGGGGAGNGGFGDGTVFKINPTTGAEEVVHAFLGGNDGYFTQTALLNVHGTLFGATCSGGASGEGTVFKIEPTTGVETVVYSFTGGHGVTCPQATIINVGGMLYGTSTFGGASGYGTVFRLNPTTGAMEVVYSFLGGRDGSNPSASALINLNGTLYGTTVYGGSYGKGTVFKINHATGVEDVVYSFAGGNDGSLPAAALINVGGTFYGTTSAGGVYGYGTVFSLTP